jgi:hypothetical protein
MDRSGDYVFISYANEDGPRVRVLADALQASGWDVWWDREIPTGQDYQQVIEAALDKAACVIVVWSGHSVASTWVKAEAESARERQALIPVAIEPVKVPVVFRLIQTADLSHWNGDPAAPAFQKLIRDLEKQVQRKKAAPAATPAAPVAPAPSPEPIRPAHRRLLAIIGGLLLTGVLVVGGKLAFDHLAAPTRIPLPASVPADTQSAVDNQPPEVVLRQPVEGSVVTRGDVTVSGYVFDDDESFVYVNGELAVIEGRLWSKTLTATGDPLVVRVIAEDADGNRAEPLERTFTVIEPPDAQAPQLSIDQPASGDVIEAGRVTLEGTVSDRGQVIVTVDGQPAQRHGDRWSYATTVEPGIREFVVHAIDDAGNRSLPQRIRLRIAAPPDTEPPRLTIETPAEGSRVEEGTITLRGTINDASASTVEVDGRPAGIDRGEWFIDVELRAGERALRITARDEAGNEAGPLVRTLWVERPSVLTLLPANATLALRIADPSKAWSRLRASLFGPTVSVLVDQTRNDMHQVGIDLDRLLASLRGEMAVWIGDLSWVGGRRQPHLPDLPILLVGDSGGGASAFNDELRRFLRAIERPDSGITVGERTLLGARHYTLAFDDGRQQLHLATRGSRYFLSSNLRFLTEIIERDGIPPRLTSPIGLRDVIAELDPSTGDIGLYASLDALTAQLLPDGPDTSGRIENPDEREASRIRAENNARVRRALGMLRGNSMDKVALGISFARDQVTASLLLAGRPPLDGLPAVLDSRPLDAQRLGPIHASADLFFGIAANLQEAIGLFNGVVGTLEGDRHIAVERILEEDLGLDPEPLVSALGRELHLFVQGDADARRSGRLIVSDTLGVALQMRDRAPVKRALRELVDKLRATLTTTPSGKPLWSSDSRATFAFADTDLVLYANRPDTVVNTRRRLARGIGRLPGGLHSGLPGQLNAVAFCRAPLLRAFVRELAELDDPSAQSPWVNGLRDTVSAMGSLLGHARWTERKDYRIELRLLTR